MSTQTGLHRPNGFDVEMVGRLIEKKKIGIGEHRSHDAGGSQIWGFRQGDAVIVFGLPD